MKAKGLGPMSVTKGWLLVAVSFIDNLQRISVVTHKYKWIEVWLWSIERKLEVVWHRIS